MTDPLGLLIPQEDLQPSSRIHGPNQWPSQLPEFEATARAYVQRMLRLGHALMRGGRAVYLPACHPPMGRAPACCVPSAAIASGSLHLVWCLGLGAGMGVTRFPGEPDTPDESYWCQKRSACCLQYAVFGLWLPVCTVCPVDMQVHADHQVSGPSRW